MALFQSVKMPVLVSSPVATRSTRRCSAVTCAAQQRPATEPPLLARRAALTAAAASALSLPLLSRASLQTKHLALAFPEL